MQALLILFGSWLVSSLVAKVFKTFFSFGVAFVTFRFLQNKLDELVSNGLSELNSLGGDFLALLNISRLDECISIFISGLVFLVMIKVLGVKTVGVTKE